MDLSLAKREVVVSAADLEAIESTDNREITSYNTISFNCTPKSWRLRRALEKVMQAYEEERAARYHVEQALDQTSQRLAAV